MWMHYARKNRTEQVDLDDKNRIIQLLRKNFGLIALGLVDEYYYLRHKQTNQVIITQSFDLSQKISEYQINKIDLFIKQAVPQRIIELDGGYHGFDELTASRQTVSRNQNYELGGFSEAKKTLIILTENDLKQSDESLVEILRQKLYA
jgi:predicted MPP superfamily phosphohydrolase